MADINYGVDVVLTSDGDLSFGDNGDFVNTQNIEQASPNDYQFDGQYNIGISLLYRLLTQTGDYQFDNDFGASLLRQISSTSMFLEHTFKDLVKNALEEDSRVKEVKSVKTNRSGNRLNISAKIKLIGSSVVSDFVFPDIYLD